MESKSALFSKTILVNVASAVVAVGMALQGQEVIADHPKAIAVVAAVVFIANCVIRFYTTQPVHVVNG